MRYPMVRGRVGSRDNAAVGSCGGVVRRGRAVRRYPSLLPGVPCQAADMHLLNCVRNNQVTVGERTLRITTLHDVRFVDADHEQLALFGGGPHVPELRRMLNVVKLNIMEVI